MDKGIDKFFRFIDWCCEYYQAAWTFGISVASGLFSLLSFFAGFDTLGWVAFCSFAVTGYFSLMILGVWGAIAYHDRNKDVATLR